MTIIAHGHVVSLSQGKAKDVRVTIKVEAERMGVENSHVTVEATNAETANYRPGTAVELRIMPLD